MKLPTVIIVIFFPIIIFCQETKFYLDIKLDTVKFKEFEDEYKRNRDSLISLLILPNDSGSFNKKSQKEGQWIEYYIDSIYTQLIKFSGFYHNNRKTGKWLEYSMSKPNNSNSWQITRTTEYSRGRMHGLCYIFGDSPSDTAIIVHYRKGKIIAMTEKFSYEINKRKRIYRTIWIEKQYDLNGTLINKEWYKETIWR
jgi:hypothetical protein